MYSAAVANVTPERDEWMRRLGPFYPGLVAICSLTAAPLPAGLQPSQDDLLRSATWFPVVGVAVGALLAMVAELLLWCGVVPALAGLLVIAVALMVTGPATATAAARTIVAMRGSTPRAGGDSPATVLTVVALVAIRVVALLATDTDTWEISLLLSEMTSYWAVLLLLHIGDAMSEPNTDDLPPLAVGSISLPALGLGSAAAAIVLVITLLLSGAVVLLSTLLAAAMAFVFGMLLQRRFGGMSHRSLAAVLFAVGLLVLLVLSVAHPADVSPWMQ